MPTSDALRRFRERTREGKSQYKLELPDDQPEDMLRAIGFLQPLDDDHEKTRAALERFVAVAIAEHAADLE